MALGPGACGRRYERARGRTGDGGAAQTWTLIFVMASATAPTYSPKSPQVAARSQTSARSDPAAPHRLDSAPRTPSSRTAFPPHRTDPSPRPPPHSARDDANSADNDAPAPERRAEPPRSTPPSHTKHPAAAETPGQKPASPPG